MALLPAPPIPAARGWPTRIAPPRLESACSRSTLSQVSIRTLTLTSTDCTRRDTNRKRRKSWQFPDAISRAVSRAGFVHRLLCHQGAAQTMRSTLPHCACACRGRHWPAKPGWKASLRYAEEVIGLRALSRNPDARVHDRGDGQHSLENQKEERGWAGQAFQQRTATCSKRTAHFTHHAAPPTRGTGAMRCKLLYRLTVSKWHSVSRDPSLFLWTEMALRELPFSSNDLCPDWRIPLHPSPPRRTCDCSLLHCFKSCLADTPACYRYRVRRARTFHAHDHGCRQGALWCRWS